METRSNYVMVGAVTMALFVGLLILIVWLSRINTHENKCFDVYFPAVGGIDKGSNVSFSGVHVGQVDKVSLLPNRPEFVWVRISVNPETPVLEGTTAQIKSISLAGANEIQLNGAVKGNRPISQLGPQGCPVIPASTGGLGALLNSAPELLERIQRLTERLTELLSDRNQNSIADILENFDRTSKVLADRAPQLADAIAEAQTAVHSAGVAAQSVTKLTDNTNRLITEQGQPAAQDLRKAIASVQQAADNLNAVIGDARPGIQNFSKSTLPEANQLVHEIRDLAGSLKQVSDRVNQQGIGGALGPEKLPDYNPGKRRR